MTGLIILLVIAAVVAVVVFWKRRQGRAGHTGGYLLATFCQ